MSVATEPDGRRTAFTRWVEKCADAMELRDWRFYLPEDDPPDGSQGWNISAYGRKLSTILVQRNLSREEMRHTLCHELVHCHIDQASSFVQNDLETFLGDVADKAFYVGYRRAVEYAVDGIATAMAPHLPLPPTKARMLKE